MALRYLFILLYCTSVTSLQAHGGSPVSRMGMPLILRAVSAAQEVAQATGARSARRMRTPMCSPTDANNPDAPEDVERYLRRNSQNPQWFEAECIARLIVQFYCNDDIEQVMNRANKHGADEVHWYVVEEKYPETDDEEPIEDNWPDDLD